MAGGLEPDDLSGTFQPKPFYDSNLIDPIMHGCGRFREKLQNLDLPLNLPWVIPISDRIKAVSAAAGAQAAVIATWEGFCPVWSTYVTLNSQRVVSQGTLNAELILVRTHITLARRQQR